MKKNLTEIMEVYSPCFQAETSRPEKKKFDKKENKKKPKD